jgi:hypothetical protein
MFSNENLSLNLIIFIFSISIYLIKNLNIIQLGGGLINWTEFNLCKKNNKEECEKALLCKWNNDSCDYKSIPKLV